MPAGEVFVTAELPQETYKKVDYPPCLICAGDATVGGYYTNDGVGPYCIECMEAIREQAEDDEE